jgi:hypothetical protein
MICERINTKKRKPFDSSRQRLKGTEYIVSAPTTTTTEARVSPPKTVCYYDNVNACDLF